MQTGSQIAKSLKLLNKSPLDVRIVVDSVNEMVGFNENYLYEGIIVYNTEDEKTYQYKSTNEVDETYGKWREFGKGSAQTIIVNELPQELENDTTYYVQTTEYSWEGEAVESGLLENRPAVAQDGTYYFGTDTNKYYVYANNAWNEITVTEASSLPTASQALVNQHYEVNDLLYKCIATLVTRIYYVDSNGTSAYIGLFTGNLSNFATRDFVLACMKIKESQTSWTDRMLQNAWCVANGTFDNNTENFLVEGQQLFNLSCKFNLTTPLNNITTADKKAFELPFSRTGEEKLQVFFYSEVGDIYNEEEWTKYFDSSSPDYIDPTQWDNATRMVKSLKLNSNGDAIQSVNVSTGELIWDSQGNPECDYEWVEINSQTNTQINMLEQPLSKGQTDNTWRVKAIDVKINTEYLYAMALASVGCRVNADKKVGLWRPQESFTAMQISGDGIGYDGTTEFIPEQSTVSQTGMPKMTFGTLRGNSIYIPGDVIVYSIEIRGVL